MKWLTGRRKLIIGVGVSIILIGSLIAVYNYNVYKQENKKLTSILSVQKDGKEDYNTEYTQLLSFKENSKSRIVSNKITNRIKELDTLADDEYNKICELLKAEKVDISDLQKHVTNYKYNLVYNSKIKNIDEFNSLIAKYQEKTFKAGSINILLENKSSNLELLEDLYKTEQGLENLVRLCEDSIDNQGDNINYPKIWWEPNKNSVQNSIDKFKEYNEKDKLTNILFTGNEYDKIGKTLVDGWNIGNNWARMSKWSNSDGKKFAETINEFNKNKNEVSSLISKKIDYMNTCESDLTNINNEKNDLYNKIVNFEV